VKASQPCHSQTCHPDFKEAIPMKKSSRNVAVLFRNLGAVSLGTLLFSQPAFADNTDPAAPVALRVQDGASALEYWTPARIDAAQPISMGREGSPQPTSVPNNATMGQDGGVGASSKSDGEETVLFGEDARGVLGITGALASEIDPAALYSYPPPSSTYTIPETWYGSFPHRAIGKLYFTRSGSNWVCSAAVINSSSDRLVQTAGHCLADGYGTWGSNFLFKPAHRPTWDAPYGTWAPAWIASTSGWLNNHNWCLDYGFMKMSSNIENAVGGLGWSYGASRYQHWHLFGYPSTWGWGGDNQVASASSWNENDAGCGSSGPYAIGVGWGQSPGSSGGPWVVSYKPQQTGNNNYINGVNSYYYTAYPQVIFSPYFGNEWFDLFQYANSL